MKPATGNHTSRYMLILVMGVAALLRLDGFSDWSLTNDELSALYGLSLGSLKNNLQVYVYEDMHPAGVQVLLWGWCRLFGTGEFMVRLPFVIMGIWSVYLIYVVGKNLFGDTCGLLSAALFAVLQYAILYAQLARPYSTGLFFSMMAMCGWSSLINRGHKEHLPEKSGAAHLILFTAGMTLCMYNHYFSFLFAALLGFSALWLTTGKKRRNIMIAGVVSVLLFLPHTGISLAQLQRGGLGWLGMPDYGYFISYIKYAFNGNLFFPLIILLSLLYIVYIRLFKINKLNFILLFLFLIPLLTAFFYSRLVSPVLQHSILLFSFPCLLLWLFSFFPDKKKWYVAGVCFVLMAGTIQVKAINRYSGSSEFAPFREIVEFINESCHRYGKNQMTFAMNIINPYYLQYYTQQLNIHPQFVFTANHGREELMQVINAVNHSRTPYFAYVWTNADCPPEINEIITEKFPYLVSHRFFFNAETYVYARTDKHFMEPPPDIRFQDVTNFTRLSSYYADINKSDLDSLKFNSPPLSFHMGPANEYGPTFRAPLKNIVKSASDIVNLKLSFCLQDIGADAQMVFTLSHKGENYHWTSMNLKYFSDGNPGWKTAYHSNRLPELKSIEDELSVYIYNPDKTTLWLDDMTIKVSAGNPRLYGIRPDEKLFTNLAD